MQQGSDDLNDAMISGLVLLPTQLLLLGPLSTVYLSSFAGMRRTVLTHSLTNPRVGDAQAIVYRPRGPSLNETGFEHSPHFFYFSHVSGASRDFHPSAIPQSSSSSSPSSS